MPCLHTRSFKLTARAGTNSVVSAARPRKRFPTTKGSCQEKEFRSLIRKKQIDHRRLRWGVRECLIFFARSWIWASLLAITEASWHEELFASDSHRSYIHSITVFCHNSRVNSRHDILLRHSHSKLWAMVKQISGRNSTWLGELSEIHTPRLKERTTCEIW